MKKFEVFVGLAEDRKQHMGNECFHVRLQMNPHGLWLDALIEILERVIKTTFAEPYCLCYPLLDLLKVYLEYFRCEIRDEGFSDIGVVLTTSLCECGRVAVSVFMSESVLPFTLHEG